MNLLTFSIRSFPVPITSLIGVLKGPNINIKVVERKESRSWLFLQTLSNSFRPDYQYQILFQLTITGKLRPSIVDRLRYSLPAVRPNKRV